MRDAIVEEVGSIRGDYKADVTDRIATGTEAMESEKADFVREAERALAEDE